MLPREKTPEAMSAHATRTPERFASWLSVATNIWSVFTRSESSGATTIPGRVRRDNTPVREATVHGNSSCDVCGSSYLDANPSEAAVKAATKWGAFDAEFSGTPAPVTGIASTIRWTR